MNERQEKIIRDTAGRIAEEFNPEKIILFGSSLGDKLGGSNDVDLFVIKNTRNTREMAREIDKFVVPRPFPMDLLVYTPDQAKKRFEMGDLFVKNILENGKVLYEKGE